MFIPSNSYVGKVVFSSLLNIKSISSGNITEMITFYWLVLIFQACITLKWHKIQTFISFLYSFFHEYFFSLNAESQARFKYNTNVHFKEMVPNLPAAAQSLAVVDLFLVPNPF